MTTIILDDFIIRAALAGAGVAVAAGPLGSFVLWRRMSYFGDATAHAAILGVALAIGFGLSVFTGVLVVAMAMALLVVRLSALGHTVDSVLGVLSHSALAVGLVAISFLPPLFVDLNAWLFGDILAVSRSDLAVIWGGALTVLALLVWRWQALLTATLNPELAASSGINPNREEVILTVALALTVAVAIKVVGALLIAAMLIVPAAASRGLARTPEAMAAIAILFGLMSVAGGLTGSLIFDTPTGPSIVSCAAVLFAVSLPVGRLISR